MESEEDVERAGDDRPADRPEAPKREAGADVSRSPLPSQSHASPPRSTPALQPSEAAMQLPRGWSLLVFTAFAAIAYWIYRAALNGPFVSDDIGYIASSPYTAELSARSIAAMFDPFGAASLYTANYAPVHLLLTAIERSIFAGDVTGFHLVNVAIHALNSTLLVALLLQSRVPAPLALLAGLFFAVHPANVEAVAWISQLKTNASLALSLGALLTLFRSPGLATALFVLGLLTKASALFALPTAAAFAWARPVSSSRGHVPLWLLAWLLLFGIYAVPQLGFFGSAGAVEVPAYADPWVHLRTISAVGMRYLVMAFSGYGVSAFQEPPPTLDPLDPWWLAALPVAAALALRLVVTLRRRSEEAAYWVAAAAAFAPVSQYFPFLIPVADRYLYFILPGLLGGASLAYLDLRERVAFRPLIDRIAMALVLGLVAWFSIESAGRARLWDNETRLFLDAARHYPEGATAALFAARRAAHEGDVATTVAKLRHAADNGIDRFMVFRDDPGLEPVRNQPEFIAFVHEMAGRWIDRVGRRKNLTAADYRVMAHAHLTRQEYARAEAMYQRALEAGGLFEAVVTDELRQLRARHPELLDPRATKPPADGQREQLESH